MPNKDNTISDTHKKDAASVETSDDKTKQTIPTLYPDIEFVNRTLP